jgi:hypothetical protein
MRAKEFIKENNTMERPTTKQKPRIIEYEDMTPTQQKIVDISNKPADGEVPMHLSDDELMGWMLDKVRNA